MCLIAYFLKTFYYFFRLVLNISLVGSWDCGFWIIWTQTPFSWLWLLQGGKGSSASSCFSSDTIWYLPISDTWLWWSPWVPVQAGPHPGPWRVLWIWQFPQAQILWGHFGSVFPTLEEAGFPVINPSRGLEPSPEITATDVGLALPAERGGGLPLRFVSDVNAGGWLPGKVSNTQILPKQNKKQLKLPSLSSWYLNKQFHLHWILSTFGLYTSKYSICINFGDPGATWTRKEERMSFVPTPRPCSSQTLHWKTVSFLALDAEEFQEDCTQKSIK